MLTTRKGLTAAACALLIAASTACGTAEKTDPPTRVRRAVEKLGEWDAMSVTVRLAARAEDIHAFLRHHRERFGGTAPGRQDARLLSRLELTFALGSDGPLEEVDEGERVDSAAAASLGGKDLAAYKSVGTDFFARVDWDDLAEELDGRNGTVERAAALAGSSDRLPRSLAAADDALRGRWVQLDPAEFDQFARSVGGRHGGRAQRLANSVGLLQSARAQHDVVAAVRRAADGRAAFESRGRVDGTERLRMTLPAGEAARDLAGALEPVEERFDGIGFDWLRRAPDRGVTAELTLRDGTLSGMTVDLGQFGPPGTGRLPLDFFFAVGEAVPVEAPERARWLDPQDVMATLLYGSLDAPGSAGAFAEALAGARSVLGR